MFSVLFEVHPKSDKWDEYLGNAKMLRPELEQVEGFVDNIRYKSLTRSGWILSLSGWRDEKSVVRWRTKVRHHEVQEKGRNEILLDYHLRVGQLTQDTHVPAGYMLEEQRLDETEIGEGTYAVLIDASRATDFITSTPPNEIAQSLGLDLDAGGLVSWDVYDAVLSPGNVIVMSVWRDKEAAASFAGKAQLDGATRLRSIRIVRDYTLQDRREAPQYYPPVETTT